MSDYKPCPFCGQELTLFGRDVRDGKVINVIHHPWTDVYAVNPLFCPLAGLVFPVDEWQKRPLEDALVHENEVLRNDLEVFHDTLADNEAYCAELVAGQSVLKDRLANAEARLDKLVRTKPLFHLSNGKPVFKGQVLYYIVDGVLRWACTAEFESEGLSVVVRHPNGAVPTVPIKDLYIEPPPPPARCSKCGQLLPDKDD